eukprot:792638-Pelagomonas_calceolata.AAC.7
MVTLACEHVRSAILSNVTAPVQTVKRESRSSAKSREAVVPCCTKSWHAQAKCPHAHASLLHKHSLPFFSIHAEISEAPFAADGLSLSKKLAKAGESISTGSTQQTARFMFVLWPRLLSNECRQPSRICLAPSGSAVVFFVAMPC